MVGSQWTLLIVHLVLVGKPVTHPYLQWSYLIEIFNSCNRFFVDIVETKCDRLWLSNMNLINACLKPGVTFSGGLARVRLNSSPTKLEEF